MLLGYVPQCCPDLSCCLSLLLFISWFLSCCSRADTSVLSIAPQKLLRQVTCEPHVEPCPDNPTAGPFVGAGRKQSR
jgi:hypothetical protein